MKKTNHIAIGQVLTIHSELNQPPANLPSADVAKLSDDPVTQILHWWQSTHTAPPTDVLAQGLTIANMICIALGIIIGMSVCSVGLTYTGDYPVNLFVLLGLVIVTPFLTLMATLAARLLRRSSNPQVNRATGVLPWIYTHFLPADHAHFLQDHLWRYVGAMYWQSQQLMQRFTLAYLCSALATLLSVITFSDIAFGWSTTLDINASQIHNITQFLSIPWQSWLPIAHPSAELVEASRFFRMNPDNNPAQLGQWWPFVAMCIVVWGIVPRLLMALLCRLKLRTWTRAALLNHPAVTALLDSIQRPNVAFESADLPALATNQPPVADAMDDHLSPKALADTDAALSWNDAYDAAIQVYLGHSEDSLRAAFSALPDHLQSVRVFVKGWEPPVLELIDFLGKLRSHLDTQYQPGISIRISPVTLPDIEFSASDQQAWQETLAKLHDGQLYLESNT